MTRRFERAAAAFLVGLLTIAPNSVLTAYADETLPAAADESELTSADLHELLEQLGYEPTETQPGFHEIKFTSGGINWVILANVLDGRVHLWSNCRPLAEGGEAPAELMALLLKWNAEAVPTSFCIVNNAVYATRSFDSSDITAAEFRRELDRYCSDIQARWAQLSAK